MTKNEEKPLKNISKSFSFLRTVLVTYWETTYRKNFVILKKFFFCFLIFVSLITRDLLGKFCDFPKERRNESTVVNSIYN